MAPGHLQCLGERCHPTQVPGKDFGHLEDLPHIRTPTSCQECQADQTLFLHSLMKDHHSPVEVLANLSRDPILWQGFEPRTPHSTSSVLRPQEGVHLSWERGKESRQKRLGTEFERTPLVLPSMTRETTAGMSRQGGWRVSRGHQVGTRLLQDPMGLRMETILHPGEEAAGEAGAQSTGVDDMQAQSQRPLPAGISLGVPEPRTGHHHLPRGKRKSLVEIPVQIRQANLRGR